ncbi:TonB-dependent receptor domain-containing protein [Croceicoccus naphthovorans]|uniref:Uncharacterized protein n=1 Tax=Croceicoccus naphthovorans TaxID=1348774 RepID=A0A0G3XJK6_9SPHN|nr:TonB-dependent receptor [Croceicoccus naphthovorans]AKM10801.1 hypothetical protein AB433_13835 [Croceicoccus naphthovorans]MBB3989008.1 outer membrane receptor protein involved in Fe transport [Croceicoccus naphthovorans]
MKINTIATRGKSAMLGGAGVIALSIAAFAAPASAQDGITDCADLDGDGVCDPASTGINADASTAEPGTIVVTGSRVRRDNFDTPNQVNVITREDAILSGATSTAEVLQNSSVTSGTAQINGSFLGYVSEGGTGANTVGLRGFGSARTLTLLNGRRLAPAGVGPELVAADLNVLPSAVVQRIEVLREGASSVYGSDAIAGVINVITDTKVDGLTLDGFTDQPIAHGGGGRTYRLSATAGKTFDRGYITGSVEYRERTGLQLNDRDSIGNCPRNLFYDPETGEEIGQIDPNTGELQCFPYTTDGGSGTASGYGIFYTFSGSGRLTYDEDGNISVVNGRDRVGPNPIQYKDDIIAPVKTLTGYLAAGYEIEALGDAEIYTEALFTRRKSSYSYSRQLSIDFNSLDLSTIEIYGGSYDGTPLSEYGYPTSPFFPNVLADAGVIAFTPFIQPNRLSKSKQEVDFMRWNGGLRGTLFGDWRYDANLQLSKTKGTAGQPQVTIDRFNNALSTVIAPDGTPAALTVSPVEGQAGFGNTYTCTSNVDDEGNFIAGSTCVPIDLMGLAALRNGAIPDNQYNYLYQYDEGVSKFRQITASFIVDGPLFELPGGTVNVALGFEHREDKINDVPSADTISGNVYRFSTRGITKGKDNVDEVFGEINLPLISDKPFARLLELSASGRYTNYASFGSDFTYHLNGQWAPNDIIRFRANYGTSFRAPNLFEQNVADQSGFYGSGVDPCNDFAGRYSPGDTIYDNCLAVLTPILGVDDPETPDVVEGALAFLSTSGPEVITQGNASTLDAETSTSYGIGGVLTIPLGSTDFSFAVDYWNVKVKGEVATLGNLILSRCYEAEDFPDNYYCNLIGDRLPASDSQRGNLDTFFNPYLNVALRQSEGIDFDARLATDLAGGELVIRSTATRMLHQYYQSFEESEPFDYNGTLGTQGYNAGPKWVGDLNFKYTFPSGNFVVNYGVDFVGPQDSSIFGEGEVASFLGEVALDLKAKSYFEHGISMQWKIQDLGQFTLGMNNIFNAKPPIISDCPSSGCSYPRVGNRFNSSAYDLIGRSLFLNVTRTF